MALTIILVCAAFLIVLSLLSLALHRSALGRIVVYGGALLVSLAGLYAGLAHLIGQAGDETAILPIGLPWLGAHFRVDPLASFFLIVVNLGGAAASLYAIGYGKHERADMLHVPPATGVALTAVRPRRSPRRV
jgi:formate hydrogenlyase subunit 3/multisubunit Na+/H+ antiporter MnhD subunit